MLWLRLIIYFACAIYCSQNDVYDLCTARVQRIDVFFRIDNKWQVFNVTSLCVLDLWKDSRDDCIVFPNLSVRLDGHLAMTPNCWNRVGSVSYFRHVDDVCPGFGTCCVRARTPVVRRHSGKLRVRLGKEIKANRGDVFSTDPVRGQFTGTSVCAITTTASKADGAEKVSPTRDRFCAALSPPTPSAGSVYVNAFTKNLFLIS